MTIPADERVRQLSATRAELLRQLQVRRAQDSVPGPGPDHEPVLMRPGAGRERVVLLHPAGGALFCYAPLVRALPPGPPIIGFPADPADIGLPATERIATVAARTLAALATVAAPGDCVLVGWSYGGAVAFEMARQHAAGTGARPPAILLDCVYYGDVELEDEPMLRRRFVYDLARLAGRDRQEVRAALRVQRLTHGPDDSAGAGLRAMLSAAQVNLELTDAELTGRYETFQACSLALQAYRPPASYPGPVTVAVAGQTPGVVARWQAVCSGPLRVVTLPGDHYTLFSPPALAQVAAAVAVAGGE